MDTTEQYLPNALHKLGIESLVVILEVDPSTEAIHDHLIEHPRQQRCHISQMLLK